MQVTNSKKKFIHKQIYLEFDQPKNGKILIGDR